MEQGGVSEGASPWEVLMEKEVPNLIKYVAYRRTLKVGRWGCASETGLPRFFPRVLVPRQLPFDHQLSRAQRLSS